MKEIMVEKKFFSGFGGSPCVKYILTVNGVNIGETTRWGEEQIKGKPEPIPEKLANIQLRKRLIVIKRNISRLEDELSEWKKKERLLNSR